jgi:hypothetical protein
MIRVGDLVLCNNILPYLEAFTHMNNRETSLDGELLRIIKNIQYRRELCKDQIKEVKTVTGTTDVFHVEIGVYRVPLHAKEVEVLFTT